MTDTPPAPPPAAPKAPEPAAEKPGKPPKDHPTKDRPRDGQGRELDEHGLPLIGPIRAAMLAKLGADDPAIDPESWHAAKISKADIGKALDAVNEDLSNG